MKHITLICVQRIILICALVLVGCGDKKSLLPEFPVAPCCDESREPVKPPDKPKPPPKPVKHYVDNSIPESLDVTLEYLDSVEATAEYKGAILRSSGQTRDEAINLMKFSWGTLRRDDQWPMWRMYNQEAK